MVLPKNGAYGRNGSQTLTVVSASGQRAPVATSDSFPARLPLASRPRRVLFFGKSMSRSRATAGLVDAFRRHGIQIKWVNVSTLRRWLGKGRALRWARSIWERFQPDLVFVFCRDLPQVLLEEFRAQTPIVLWVEQPMATPDISMAQYMSLADLVVLSNPARCGWLAQHGVRRMLFQMDAFSPRYHYPLPSRRVCRQVAFVGGPGPMGRRATFLAAIAEHFDLEIFGLGWDEWRRRYPKLRVRGPVKAPGFRRVCATSSIVLGLNQINDDPLYFSNRTFLTLACRTFHLTHYVPKLETVFQDGEHLAWYHDQDECLTRIEHYLKDDEGRARIASNGYRLVLQQHQFHQRIEQILNALTGEIPALPDPSVLLRSVPTHERG